MRREAVRQAANQMQPDRQRSLVRPLNPPLKVMPKAPAPAPGLNSFRRPSPPTRLPATPRPGVVAAAAAGAVVATGLANLDTANADTAISAEVSALQNSLSDLQTRSLFGDIQSETTSLDQLLAHLSELLESARQKGYAYQSDLESAVYDLVGKWQAAAPTVSQAISQNAHNFQGRVLALNTQVNSLNRLLGNPGAATPVLRNVQSQVNNLLSEVGRVEGDLRRYYSELDSQARRLTNRLNNIHWGMDQLSQSRLKLESAENLVMAVKARWDKEGKEDPEGILYLTNRRLVFERKEKVATKKILFITTASELVQEVLFDQRLGELGAWKAENKGLFGHQDFLQVQLARLGDVALHLDGQDSKDWANLLERARSGQIESEHAALATGVSLGELTRPLTNADIMELQSRVAGLQDEAMLAGPRQELAALENDLSTIERNLSEARARGYHIEKNLEADLAVMRAQWERVESNSVSTLEYQASQLGAQMESIQKDLARLMGLASDLAAARPLYLQIKSSLASVEAQADAAEDTVLAQYDEYADEVQSLLAHLEWVDWMLQALSSASFRLLATESGVAATEAVFLNPNAEPENGILFLTDQRLLWEDRVGAYELKVEVPLQAVLEVQKEALPAEASSAEQQVLAFQLGPQAALPLARFQLALPVAEDWLQKVGRARSGGYSQDRAVPISQEELERVRNAPQQCKNCGAAFTAPILRGQTELRCQYCGLVTHL